MKGWTWMALGVVLVAGLSYVAYETLRPAELPTGLLYANGFVEGTEITVSAEIAGRVVENRLMEGQVVNAGDVLVRLDDAEPQARFAQAELEVDALGQTRKRLEQELETARHHLASTQADLERYRALRKRGTVSPQQLNQAEDRLQEAQGRVQTLESQRKETDVGQEAARQQAQVFRLQLDKAEIRAPISGTVLSKAIELGELAMPGRTVAMLVDLTLLEVRAFVPVADVGRIGLGNPARVKVDAYPDRLFTATVRRLDQEAQFTPRDIHVPEERARLVFGVTLAVESPGGELKPGMPADIWILWDEALTWPERLPIPR